MIPPVRLFVILLQLAVVVSLFCSDSTCKDCTSGSSCRWCKRDNECHMPYVLTNPCKRAENIVSKSDCDNEFSRYDTDLSWKMLLLSAAAYDPVHPQECLNNSLPSAKFQIHSVVTRKCDFFDNECSGYVAISHALKVIVVAFRGSADFGQAFSLFVETLLAPKEDFIRGEVQTYWKRGFDNLWPCLKSDVKALISANPSYKVWITGHSLGGAMASLLSTWLARYYSVPRKNLILYTYGMPRVGNYDYAYYHDQMVNNSWRVVNDDDAVPHFPSVASVSIFNGPYHHGVEAFYSRTATSVNSEHRECHGKPYNEDATCSFSEITRSFERHTNYFGIPVGTFWETACVQGSLRKRRETSRESTPTAKKFQFLKDRCTKYRYKSGAYVQAVKSASPSVSTNLLRSFYFVFLVISIAH